MTQPTTEERRSKTIPLAGRDVLVKEMTETQMLHGIRYSRILTKDGVGLDEKADAAARLLAIVHSCIALPEDRDYLIEKEEEGELGLQDLLGTLRAFREVEDKPVKAAVTRGRPRSVRK